MGKIPRTPKALPATAAYRWGYKGDGESFGTVVVYMHTADAKLVDAQLRETGTGVPPGFQQSGKPGISRYQVKAPIHQLRGNVEACSAAARTLRDNKEPEPLVRFFTELANGMQTALRNRHTHVIDKDEVPPGLLDGTSPSD